MNQYVFKPLVIRAITYEEFNTLHIDKSYSFKYEGLDIRRNESNFIISLSNDSALFLEKGMVLVNYDNQFTIMDIIEFHRKTIASNDLNLSLSDLNELLTELLNNN